MTEELKIDDIADVVKSHVEEKADKSELDAVKEAVDGLEIPSVEGFAKSEDVSAANEAIEAIKGQLEELTVKFDSAPAIVSKEVPAMDSFKWDNEGFNAKAEVDLSKEITKAYPTTTQVTGEPTSTARLYYALQQGNPFRMVSTVMPMNSSTMELPVVSGISALSQTHPCLLYTSPSPRDS